MRTTCWSFSPFHEILPTREPRDTSARKVITSRRLVRPDFKENPCQIETHKRDVLWFHIALRKRQLLLGGRVSSAAEGALSKK